MKRRILLPTDFSNNAWHAMLYAIELYKEDSCDFFILNVFSATGNIMDSLLNMEPGSELYELAKEKSETGLAQVLDKITLQAFNNPKHHFSTISTFNNPLEAIKNTVEEKDIELVVMGCKGRTNSDKSSFGSVSLYVMEKVRNCPVIVVPKRATYRLPKEIVFPTSYKTHFKQRELNYLVDIAKKCHATIAVLHISNDEKLDKIQVEHKTMLETYFEDVSTSFHTLNNYAVQTALNIFVESRNSDMVAFINKKHTFFDSILTHPMVKELNFHASVPILVMHDLRN
ncbi:universal stress protein [Lacinutrix neustonica]|uniref:Universal stress protein n=1 Tax=Lacinutrix neustonica TaxID=2980107 RepID=A0A9E8MXY9_9FLAO|nr:universal stress protein [Lacinutrix neustonica]WAC02324.1 universal stress protein [Lacinutrix neustonica]